MRTSLTFLCVVLIIAIPLISRTQDVTPRRVPTAELLTQLRSDSAATRNNALENLSSDRSAMDDPEIKTELVNLLDRENQLDQSDEDEGYAEYLDWLSEMAAEVVDWSDSRQVCILANSFSIPVKLSDHAKVAVPCLLKRLKSGPNKNAPEPDLRSRMRLIPALVQALEKGRSDLDVSTIDQIQRVVMSGLTDRNKDVRGTTVGALEDFGGTDMIPALEKVAQTDSDSDPSNAYSIRMWASRAIVAIQRRAEQQK